MASQPAQPAAVQQTANKPAQPPKNVIPPEYANDSRAMQFFTDGWNTELNHQVVNQKKAKLMNDKSALKAFMGGVVAQAKFLKGS